MAVQRRSAAKHLWLVLVATLFLVGCSPAARDETDPTQTAGGAMTPVESADPAPVPDERIAQSETPAQAPRPHVVRRVEPEPAPPSDTAPGEEMPQESGIGTTGAEVPSPSDHPGNAAERAAADTGNRPGGESPPATQPSPVIEPSPIAQPDEPAATSLPQGATATSRLAALSDAFRNVARTVKPSVVQVAAEVRPGAVPSGISQRLSPEEMDQLAQQYGPLVELDPELRQFFRGGGFEQESRQPNYQQYNVPMPIGSASGWVYDDQGHIVTNHHVVAQSDYFVLTFSDGTQAGAELVGSDPQTDIAVLKTNKQGLTPATLSSETAEQGDIVLAVGSPFQYAFSVSQGIVSATDRQMGILGPQGYENFIQTDAAINPGNSGGPLINARGQVIGMNSAIASRSGAFAGIGFAIPTEMIRDVVEDLIATGRVERGYLGAMIDDSQPLLASFGVDRGVLIEDVVDGGPADQAGLLPGDVVTELNGQPIGEAARFRREVAQTDPGQTIQLSVIRDDQPTTVDVTLQQLPGAEHAAARSPRRSPTRPEESVQADAPTKLGLEQLQTITPDIASRYDLQPSRGVLVLGVRQYSAAAAAGLRRGSIITHVQGQRVSDTQELQDALEGRDLSQGVRMRVHVPGGPGRFVMLALGE